MANILNKVVRVKKKEHKVKTRVLGLKGSKAYLLKRDGTAKPFTILAVFDYYLIEFSNFRHSSYFKFAAAQDEIFKPFATERTMRAISSIATHIAVVEASGASTVYTIRNGDEWAPVFMDWEYTFFATQTKDTFVPTDNQDS